MRVSAVRPVEHHGRRAEQGWGDVDAAFLEEGFVNEDIAEPDEVAEVHLVVAVDAVEGPETVVESQARHELHVCSLGGGNIVGFVEELDGDLHTYMHLLARVCTCVYGALVYIYTCVVV